MEEVIKVRVVRPYILEIEFSDGKQKIVDVGQELKGAELREEDVLLVEFPPANAIKATIPRLHGSGAVEDSDVYGAQQHGPLMDVEIPG